MHTRWLKPAWALCGVSGVCLAAALLLSRFNGGTAHNARESLLFLKLIVFQMLFGVSLCCTALLFSIALWSLIKQRAYKRVAVASLFVSISFYVGALVVFFFAGFAKTCSWKVETYIKGADSRTYYILHAPSPANGAGHSALARRTGGNSLFYTMKIISSDDYGSNHYRGVLVAALQDRNPETRRAAKMLLRTLKQRDIAKERNSDRAMSSRMR
ncbi:MAG TPA: hypothetical protein VF600_07235 [Abditibacteriaceae bacterium]|jgi:hypothetical protein